LKNNSFTSVTQLIGIEAFNRISQTHILVIGLGGVGSWCVETLIRNGVSRISLVDLDDVCSSNISRQLIATQKSIGKLKVDLMEERILEINPECKIHKYMCFYNDKNHNLIFSQHYDFVIDCFDQWKKKYLLAKYCYMNKIKLIITGATAGKKDLSLIACKDLSLTAHDFLLKQIRNKLKKEFNLYSKKKMNILAIYSEENIKPHQNHIHNSCESFGSIMSLTASIGIRAAHEAIEILTND